MSVLDVRVLLRFSLSKYGIDPHQLKTVKKGKDHDPTLVVILINNKFERRVYLFEVVVMNVDENYDRGSCCDRLLKLI